MVNLIGQSVGRYHIIEQLGEGGMATVYKAYDTHLECEVAVKVIRTDLLAPILLERALKRFEHEAKAVAKLNHPNIVKVSDYGEYEDSPYLVMPYLVGGTIKSLMKERGRLPWQEAVKLVIPIAEALDYAHEHGVIHRDIKPSNILLTEKGQPMLTDFGVAKIIGDEATQELTGTSTTVGTPEYMAPEQITSKTVDGRVDIYGLGVVLYEMITGRRPYEADTFYAVMLKQANDPLPEASQFVKDLPREVEYVLIKALAKRPEDRYGTCHEFQLALEKLLGGQTIQTAANSENPLSLAEDKKEFSTVQTVVESGDFSTVVEEPGKESLPEVMPVVPVQNYVQPAQPQMEAPEIKKRRKSGKPFLWVGLAAILLTALVVLFWMIRDSQLPVALIDNFGSSSGSQGAYETVNPFVLPTAAPTQDTSSNSFVSPTETVNTVVPLTVWNKTELWASYYLDGTFIERITPGGNYTKNVTTGSHVIQICFPASYNSMECRPSQSIYITQLDYFEIK